MSEKYNIINATVSAFKRCTSIEALKNGRAGRAEFWWFMLGQYAAMVIVSFILELFRILLGMLVIMEVLNLNWVAVILIIVVLLVLIIALIYGIPTLGVMIRRLHDINRSGWNVLWSLLPVFGQIYLLVMFCKKGDDTPNEYGEAPNAPLEVNSKVMLKLQNFFSTR